MFIGHYGIALAAKPVASPLSLGTLCLAAQLPDLLWGSFLQLGLESAIISPGSTTLTPIEFSHYPISHSLLTASICSLLLGLVCLAVYRNRVAALVCGGLVVAHWCLDVLVHNPDLLVYPGSDAALGLGLWNRPALAVLLEVGILLVGLLLYCRATRACDKIGTFALWTFIGFLLVVYAASAAGPPPPSIAAVAWSAQAQWLLIVWAYWIDRHRRKRSP